MLAIMQHHSVFGLKAAAAAAAGLCFIVFLVGSSDLCVARATEGAGGVDQTSSGRCPCEEIYVVREGETLHTISARCEAPFLLLDNPQIQDGDDISQGLALLVRCVR